MNNKKGKFITFEGPEASGKSSQIKILKNYLISKRIKFIITREPGGTKFAENLRRIILNNKSKINNIEEIMLLMAARSNHINDVIIPNLNKGKIVISDRFADSTFVYQGYVNKFDVNKLKNLHSILLNNFYPDYTFIFKLDIHEISRRLKKRKNKNKYDKIDNLFHKKVINGYKKISIGKRFVNIDASLSKDIIHKKIVKILNL